MSGGERTKVGHCQSVKLIAGGGVERDLPLEVLQQAIVFPEWGSGDWFAQGQASFATRQRQGELAGLLDLNAPLGRKAVYFWMDLLSAVSPPEEMQNPFLTSARLAYLSQRLGGAEQQNHLDPHYGGDNLVQLLYGFDYRIGASFVTAPPVLRHFTDKIYFPYVLESSTLVAGPASYAQRMNRKPRVKNYYPDVVGVFMTVPGPANSGFAVGASNDGAYYVDFELPSGTLLLKLASDKEGGEIYLIYGPPGVGEYASEEYRRALPYDPLKIPISIVAASMEGEAGKIVERIRPELLQPADAVLGGGLAAAGAGDPLALAGALLGGKALPVQAVPAIDVRPVDITSRATGVGRSLEEVRRIGERLERMGPDRIK